MTDYRDIFRLFYQHMYDLEEPCVPEDLFSQEEECPFGNAAYLTLEKGITIYREEIIQQEVPDEVHLRLQRFIQSQWSFFYRETDNDNRKGL